MKKQFTVRVPHNTCTYITWQWIKLQTFKMACQIFYSSNLFIFFPKSNMINNKTLHSTVQIETFQNT